MQFNFKKIYTSPLSLFALFVVATLVFSIVYSYVPLSDSKNNKFLTGLYLSFSTITTLGYGDVYIVHSGWRLLTSLQAFIGLVLMGLFLNSIWYWRTQEMDKLRKDADLSLIKEKNIEQLKTYCLYFKVIVFQYEMALNYLLFGDSKRGERQASFQKMSEMYLPTGRFVNGLRESRLEVYRDARDDLVSEMKNMFLRFDLDCLDGEENEVSFSNLAAGFFVGDSLADLIKSLLSYTPEMRADLRQMISQKGDENFKIDVTKPTTIITPAIMLYSALVLDDKMLSWIKGMFDDAGISLEMPFSSRGEGV